MQAWPSDDGHRGQKQRRPGAPPREAYHGHRPGHSPVSRAGETAPARGTTTNGLHPNSIYITTSRTRAGRWPRLPRNFESRLPIYCPPRNTAAQSGCLFHAVSPLKISFPLQNMVSGGPEPCIRERAHFENLLRARRNLDHIRGSTSRTSRPLWTHSGNANCGGTPDTALHVRRASHPYTRVETCNWRAAEERGSCRAPDAGTFAGPPTCAAQGHGASSPTRLNTVIEMLGI